MSKFLIKIDGVTTDLSISSPLKGFDSNGSEVEIPFKKGMIDSFTKWVYLEKVIVQDEFENDIILNTKETNITGFDI